MATAAASSRARALALYRDVLRAHRALPAAMRSLGDAYVREEFRRHRSAKPQFLGGFFREWEAYVASLRAGPVLELQPGRNLSPDVIATMSDDQQAQLARLRQEVVASVAADPPPLPAGAVADLLAGGGADGGAGGGVGGGALR
jgi:hypothetical protein